MMAVYRHPLTLTFSMIRRKPYNHYGSAGIS